jgi:uncharacterized membrane protein YeaQ/YmgE (transglycosylase-associated protein family)
MAGFGWWLLIGLVAGLLARMLVPGEQPMGWVEAPGLGLVGSVVGGFLASVVFGTNPSDTAFHARGLIMSAVGAVIVLAAYATYARGGPLE